ncbi:MAG: hypothetical protein HYS69_14920 [candidate division NC10 bacterium]|nr:hypothetical protein [candidate division NC10 bacterium]
MARTLGPPQADHVNARGVQDLLDLADAVLVLDLQDHDDAVIINKNPVVPCPGHDLGGAGVLE